jgi:metallophosphoesterase superfamily enzyme
LKHHVEENCYKAVRQVFEEFKPHLIILTGDFVYGQFDDNGSMFLNQIEFFDSLKTPWAPVFGNHDQESKMGADWQCAQRTDSLCSPAA